jgi:hypothetical protein
MGDKTAKSRLSSSSSLFSVDCEGEDFSRVRVSSQKGGIGGEGVNCMGKKDEKLTLPWSKFQLQLYHGSQFQDA